MSSNFLQNEWATSYLSGGSMAYVDGLYEDYLADPKSVSEEWQAVFHALPTVSGQAVEVPHRPIRDYFLQHADKKIIQVGTADTKQAQVAHLINAYRQFGHHAAQLDPLDMCERMSVPNLDLSYHNLSDSDLSQTFYAGKTFPKENMSLKDIYQVYL